jgi:23S rRNA (guanosine2251-2'-O)-methyltransferase
VSASRSRCRSLFWFALRVHKMDGEDSRRYVYGIKPVLEALRAHGTDIEHVFIAQGNLDKGPAGEVFARARELGLRVQKVPREKLSSLSAGGLHQGVVAEIRQFSYSDLQDLIGSGEKADRLIVVLDGIQDPNNLGAIIRSALAFGAQGVVLPKDRAAQVTGAVVKSSAGAVEHMPVARVVNISRALEELKQAGFWVAVLDLDGTQTPGEVSWTGPIALVVGSEGAGVRPGVLKHCDFRVRIPLSGKVSSLNASVAAGVALYQIGCSRRAASKT